MGATTWLFLEPVSQAFLRDAINYAHSYGGALDTFNLV
jgi:hypothetical protein